ncbi:MAG: hypothetical protein WC906_03010 [Parcubacteria group bacterium]|jgi:hypothetical protein
MKRKEEKSQEEISENNNSHKIQSLREMINNAEKTIQSAKAMLLNLEGKKKTGRKRKVEEETDGTVVEGTFDGQIMIGTDGKQYPVPANYASKSKLVEGDMLKLTITVDGSFIYKQIGPANRKHALGIISQDESENYNVIIEGRPFRVLLASITYFKAEPGDEVAVVMPKDIESSWIAIENVLQKGTSRSSFAGKYTIDDDIESLKKELKEKPEGDEEKADEIEIKPSSVFADVKTLAGKKATAGKSVIDEWTADIEEIEREMQKEKARPVE